MRIQSVYKNMVAFGIAAEKIFLNIIYNLIYVQRNSRNEECKAPIWQILVKNITTEYINTNSIKAAFITSKNFLLGIYRDVL